MKMKKGYGLKERDIIIRADRNFKKEIDDIILERIKLGKENPLRPHGSKRITKAIRRHSKWMEIKQDIIRADLE